MNRKHDGRGYAEDICIWQNGTDCGDCGLAKILFCKPSSTYRLYFALPFFAALIPAVIGIATSGYSLAVSLGFFAGWFGYAFFFLNVWESRMLCNHCPWYANDEELVLHCPIDVGKLKTGRFDPRPLTRGHKLQFLIGAGLLLIAPLPMLAAAGKWIYLGCTVGGEILWAAITQTKVCTACINFSCPLNRVDAALRNQFLDRNPVLREAWEKAGRMDGPA